jgi:hypothetical protein
MWEVLMGAACLALLPSSLVRADDQSAKVTFVVIAWDPSSAPIKGAVARLLSLDRVVQVKSGEDGVLSFAGVVPGTYDLEISRRFFLTQTLRDIQISDSTTPLNVTLQLAPMPDHCRPVDLVDYVDSDSSRVPLSGRVLDADSNAPLRGAKVEALRRGEKRIVASTRSDKTGEFVIDELPAGRYDLRILKDGYRHSGLKNFLVPREDSTFVTVFLASSRYIVICQ